MSQALLLDSCTDPLMLEPGVVPMLVLASDVDVLVPATEV